MAHYIKQNDRRPYIRRRLKDAEGDYVDLTDAAISTLTFSMAPKNNHSTLKVSAQSAEVGYGANDGSGGHCEYQWQAGDTDTIGEFDAEWTLTFTDGTTQTFPSGTWDVVIVRNDL